MSPLLDVIRTELQGRANPERAAQMQRYMKSVMPYHGVALPVVRDLCRVAFAGLRFESRESWERAVLEIWEGALFREEWYAALTLAGHRSGARFRTPESLLLFERLIVEGAWWDVVDDVATHRIGPLMRAYPTPIKLAMRTWARGPDVWKQRAAMICQVGLKKAADTELLLECIEPSIHSKEFFLRKAIGWALREHAKTFPDVVVAYVKAREADLSSLSKREAIRHLGDVTWVRPPRPTEQVG